MKTAKDPRHVLRRRLVKKLYEASFSNKVKNIFRNVDEIDELIISAAPEWPLSKINRVDLAILRLGVHEIMERKNPEKVIIDEAVELAKEYGSEASASFVNGVLGKILNEKH